METVVRDVAVGLLGRDSCAQSTMLPYPFAVAENRDVSTLGQGDFTGLMWGLDRFAQTLLSGWRQGPKARLFCHSR